MFNEEETDQLIKDIKSLINKNINVTTRQKRNLSKDINKIYEDFLDD